MSISTPIELGECFQDTNAGLYVQVNQTIGGGPLEYAIYSFTDSACSVSAQSAISAYGSYCAPYFSPNASLAISYFPCTAGLSNPAYADPDNLLLLVADNCDPAKPTIVYNYGNATEGQCVPFGSSYASLVSFSGVLYVALTGCDSACQTCQQQYELGGLGACASGTTGQAEVNAFSAFDSCYLSPTTTTAAPVPITISFYTTTQDADNDKCDMTQQGQYSITTHTSTEACTLNPVYNDYFVVYGERNGGYLALYHCDSDCKSCQGAVYTNLGECSAMDNNTYAASLAIVDTPCPAGFTPPSAPSNFVYYQYTTQTTNCNVNTSGNSILFNFGAASSSEQCQPFIDGTYGSVTQLGSSYVALIECATSNCLNCAAAIEFKAEGNCVIDQTLGGSSVIGPLSAYATCYVPPTTIPPPPLVWIGYINSTYVDFISTIVY